ncbi:unnamed protein product, partial [Schistosoma curassoni]|uniref:Uncharacterized protein n=1 Tax=Schistosoma curassoni TaxID=6186 RepID=A0A183KPU7_9TREM
MPLTDPCSSNHTPFFEPALTDICSNALCVVRSLMYPLHADTTKEQSMSATNCEVCLQCYPVQAVLVSFQNDALDELGASANHILEITKSSATEVFPLKEKPQTTQNDITKLCHTLTRYLKFRNDRKQPHTLRRSTSLRRSVSRPRETGAGIITNISVPIIGIDLLQHQNLLIDTRKRRLVDGNTNLSVCVTFFSGRRLSPVTIKRTIDPIYQLLLGKYPGVQQTRPKLPCVTSNVTHRITTTGPPVFSKA